MQTFLFGGFNEWDIGVYFGPLFVLVKTLLDALTNSAMHHLALSIRSQLSQKRWKLKKSRNCSAPINQIQSCTIWISLKPWTATSNRTKWSGHPTIKNNISIIKIMNYIFPSVKQVSSASCCPKMKPANTNQPHVFSIIISLSTFYG